MKILASGDIHGDVSLAKKLADRAKKEHVDLVVLCGDMVLDEEHTSGIIGPFVKNHQRVLLVPGNHESAATADFLAELYGVKNIHGYHARYNDIGFFGAGGAQIGPHPVSEHEIYDLLKKGYDKIRDLPKRIMVTHVHPARTTMEKFSNFVEGSDSVRRAIEKFKPDFALCSHVHEAEGIEETIGKTKVINVGRKGKIIEI